MQTWLPNIENIMAHRCGETKYGLKCKIFEASTEYFMGISFGVDTDVYIISSYLQK